MTKPLLPWLERATRVLDEDGRCAFSAGELDRVLIAGLEKMQAPASYGPPEIRRAFLSAGLLHSEEIKPLTRPKANDGSEYRVMKRYVRKGVSAVQVGLSFRPNSFISHGSAAQHHGLIPVSVERVYVNKEQSPKPENVGSLSQESIDRAFSNSPRISNLLYAYKKTEIVMLSGKNTANHGVIKLSGKLGKSLQTTSLERTLVDMTVRPAYSGGVQLVMTAFLAARKAISVPRIVAALEALEYTYPYHQAVGFYLERAGISEANLAPLKKLPIDFNFYLAHKLRAPTLDMNWRVFYPKELEGASFTKTKPSFTKRSR